MRLIYVAGPYTAGDTAQNVRNAIDTAEAVRRKGWTPFLPHTMYAGWEAQHPHLDWDAVMAMCLDWVSVCDAIIRIPGESRGADAEERAAATMGIPIYHHVDEVPE